MRSSARGNWTRVYPPGHMFLKKKLCSTFFGQKISRSSLNTLAFGQNVLANGNIAEKNKKKFFLIVSDQKKRKNFSVEKSRLLIVIKNYSKYLFRLLEWIFRWIECEKCEKWPNCGAAPWARRDACTAGRGAGRARPRLAACFAFGRFASLLPSLLGAR